MNPSELYRQQQIYQQYQNPMNNNMNRHGFNNMNTLGYNSHKGNFQGVNTIGNHRRQSSVISVQQARQYLRLIIDLNHNGVAVTDKNMKSYAAGTYHQSINISTGTVHKYRWLLVFYELRKESRKDSTDPKKPQVLDLYNPNAKLKPFVTHVSDAVYVQLDKFGGKGAADNLKQKMMKFKNISNWKKFKYQGYKYYGL